MGLFLEIIKGRSRHWDDPIVPNWHKQRHVHQFWPPFRKHFRVWSNLYVLYVSKCLYYQNQYLTDFLKIHSHLSSWAINYRSSKFLFLMCFLYKFVWWTDKTALLLTIKNHYDKTFLLNHVVFWMKFSWCSVYIFSNTYAMILNPGIFQFYNFIG